MPKVKDKERILKAAREKQGVTYKGVPIRLSADFSKETAGKKGLTRSIQSDKNQGPTNKITPPSKAIIQNGRADKVLPTEGKAKGIHHHHVKGTYLRKQR